MPDPEIDHRKLSDKAFELGDKIEETGFDSLSSAEKAFYSIWLYTAEVNSGGYDRYYRYDGANFAEETVKALQMVGRDELASNLAAANRMFSSINLSSIDERETLLEEMDKEDKKRLASLFSPVFSYSPYADLWQLMHPL